MKTPGIPIGVTVVLALIIALSIFSSSLALVDNGLEDYMGGSWGGRNLGLALVTAIAIWSKSAVTYMAALLGSIAREVGDIVQQFQADEAAWGIVAFAAVLMLVWVYGLNAANRARLTLAKA